MPEGPDPQSGRKPLPVTITILADEVGFEPTRQFLDLLVQDQSLHQFEYPSNSKRVKESNPRDLNRRPGFRDLLSTIECYSPNNEKGRPFGAFLE